MLSPKAYSLSDVVNSWGYHLPKNRDKEIVNKYSERYLNKVQLFKDVFLFFSTDVPQELDVLLEPLKMDVNGTWVIDDIKKIEVLNNVLVSNLRSNNKFRLFRKKIEPCYKKCSCCYEFLENRLAIKRPKLSRLNSIYKVDFDKAYELREVSININPPNSRGSKYKLFNNGEVHTNYSSSFSFNELKVDKSNNWQAISSGFEIKERETLNLESKKFSLELNDITFDCSYLFDYCTQRKITHLNENFKQVEVLKEEIGAKYDHRRVVSTSYKNIAPIFSFQRDSILNFKKGKNQIDLIRSLIISYGKDFFLNKTIVPIPSSDELNNTKRWKSFIGTLCNHTGANNGFDLIKIKNKISKNSGGEPLNKNNLIIDKKLIHCKSVILIDDVYTSGNTIRTCLEKILLESDIDNIECLFLSKTIEESLSFERDEIVRLLCFEYYNRLGRLKTINQDVCSVEVFGHFGTFILDFLPIQYIQKTAKIDVDLPPAFFNSFKEPELI